MTNQTTPNIQMGTIRALSQPALGSSPIYLDFDRPVRLTPEELDFRFFVGDAEIDRQQQNFILEQTGPTRLSISCDEIGEGVGQCFTVFVPEGCKGVTVLEGSRLRAALTILKLQQP